MWGRLLAPDPMAPPIRRKMMLVEEAARVIELEHRLAGFTHSASAPVCNNTSFLPTPNAQGNPSREAASG
jgi:hypothetical protein